MPIVEKSPREIAADILSIIVVSLVFVLTVVFIGPLIDNLFIWIIGGLIYFFLVAVAANFNSKMIFGLLS
jgi:hypothetical protein